MTPRSSLDRLLMTLDRLSAGKPSSAVDRALVRGFADALRGRDPAVQAQKIRNSQARQAYEKGADAAETTLAALDIADVLYPDGSEDEEWDSDTLGQVDEVLRYRGLV
ncbi:MAG TPA: hypothetical protein ENJ85_05160 [Oceanithermus profundus]|uniref:Uncharacterized protein n=1 Tax=Oceanithermus profundus TaxID=187137 RepID=A0A7C5SQV8_9DEIN|nr:hypothetical protein [Oceanithermus profundus]